MKNIVIGEWFCAVDGIAIAERIHDFYYEEYDHIPEGKNVGDYELSMVEGKEFCDYEGKITRRNRFKISNMDYCGPMEKKYKKVLDESIKNHPKEYESFLKFLKVPKSMDDTLMLRYELSEDNKLQTVQAIERIQQTLPPKFTFEDIIKKAEELQCPIDLRKEPLTSTYFIPCYLILVLHYTYGEFEGKRVLFNRLGYIVREKKVDQLTRVGL